MTTVVTHLRPTASPRRRGRRARPLTRLSLASLILGVALIAFEIFNYSTTEFALQDLLGELRFAGVHWATILALAFCSMDFAGIARLLTPAGARRHSLEAWYLLGAWFLAATMNAMLTWWAVSVALLAHQALGNAVLGRETLLRVAPLFVALLVWLIRILMIGMFTLSASGPQASARPSAARQSAPGAATPSAAPRERPAAGPRGRSARRAE